MSISVDTVSKQAKQYFANLKKSSNFTVLADLEPVTIGWKVKDIEEYCADLSFFLKSGLVEQCHIGAVDNRYIASLVFKKPIYKNIYIIKLMQRRPGSTDSVGLDHVDFFVNNLASMEKQLARNKVTDWGYESNQSHRWISLRFNESEAKFVDHTVLDVCVKELQAAGMRLGHQPRTVN